MKTYFQQPFNPVKRRPLVSEETAREAIHWGLEQADKPVLTTNFKPYSVVLIHAVTQVMPDIPVVWVDTGFNTEETKKYAMRLSSQLSLNLKIYRPHKSTAEVLDLFDGVPEVDQKGHASFTELVKLEPFRRAFAQLDPDVWFTNIRKGQTAFRDTLDIASYSQHGILKVSPFYYWTSGELHDYVDRYQLPMDWSYSDPTKGLAHRECGIQF